MQIELSLSTDYVSHWGLWEALRELYQNAMDEELWEIRHDSESLRIITKGGQLARESLLLGASTKSGDSGKRGQYGEGYKLALLVLCRLGHAVTIRTGGEVWTPRLVDSETFGARVLAIDIQPDDVKTDGVTICVEGVTEEQFLECETNLCMDFGVLSDPGQVGRIYVGSLYVCTMPDFKRGYSFKVGEIELDRDRQMVKQLDLSWATSKLWANEEQDESAIGLMEEEAPDTQYISHLAYSHSPAVKHLDRTFPVDVVPVSTQEEIQEAVAAGVKYRLVPRTIRELLGKIRSIRIPTGHKTPIQRLEKLKKQLSGELAEELADIIKELKS
ncbi:MAG: hypothetical protein COA69_09580 [Robiginitomaculum sp.]|nr:MAG: hypothetical protein COA69_09580 [Robiginitomaculum sp.]